MVDETTPVDEPPTKEPKYDQRFFLKLARQGKDEWNAWRRDPANKDVRVTFAGIDFSQAPRDHIDFSGFEFGDYVDFSGRKWRGVQREDVIEERRIVYIDRKAFMPGLGCFSDATFGSMANFNNATFGDGASFGDAIFGDYAAFKQATFGSFTIFSGATFTIVSFTSTTFGRWSKLSKFSKATFGDITSFNGATFGEGACFSNAIFGDYTYFTRATFSWAARFVRTIPSSATFAGAIFDEWATFTGATFNGEADFTGATFGERANFTGAYFGYKASFFGTAFGNEANFSKARFKGRVEFTGNPMVQWESGLKAKVTWTDRQQLMALKQRHAKAWRDYESWPDRFLTISFSNVRFYDDASFSGRPFKNTADFTSARFYHLPDFDGVTGAAQIDFTGAHIGFVRPGRPHWTFQSRVPVRLRALRKMAEDTKNHDLERDLYIEERKAERGIYLVQRFIDWVRDPKKKWALIAHVLWILVMSVYRALADYGRSFARPAIWLVSSVWVFHWGYAAILAPLMPQAGTPDAAKYERAVGMLALGNAVPFVGPLTIDSKIKEFLFCPNNAASCLPPIPPEGFQFLMIFQNLFSITCVFFIGLALRNYFRIK